MASRPASQRTREQRLLASIREGWSHIRSEPVIAALLVFGLVYSVFAQSYVQLLPAVAHESLGVGAVELSWLVGASGFGALFGTAVAALVGGVRRIGWFLIGDTVLVGSLLALLGLQRELVPSLMVLALMGGAVMVYNGTQSSVIQTLVPDEYRGRVMGLMVALLQAGAPLGTLLVGTLGSVIGVSNALSVSGLTVIACSLFVVARVGAIRDVVWRGEA